MRKALLIGIDDYPNDPLDGCVNDAVAVENTIEKHGDGSPNFAVQRKDNIATSGELRTSIDELFAGDADVALLYFSGHGFFDSTGGYLVTPDHQKGDAGLSMDVILNIANNSKIKNKVIVFDCCHSGAFGSPANMAAAAQLAEGVVILTASRDNESAIEIDGHGVFTELFVDALQGGAATLTGDITPGSIYAYIDQALGAWDQRPVFKTNVNQFISLRKTVPPIETSILRKITAYFESIESEHKLDPSYEPTEEPKNEINEAIFSELQKMNRVGLVAPVGEEHMYYAAMNSKSCKLTTLGAQYWRHVQSGKI